MVVEETIKFLKEKRIRVTLSSVDELDVVAPKGVVTPEIIQLLKDKKQQLVTYLSHFSFDREEIRKVEHEEKGYPLSYAQKKIWFLSQIEERSVAYTIVNAVTINEMVDKQILEQAIRSTIGRHESLRTVFRKNGEGDIEQWIKRADEVAYVFNFLDLRAAIHKEGAVEAYITKDQASPFNLEDDISLRTCLFQLEDNKFVFYSIQHHITSDGVSMNILVRDVLEYYRAHMQGDKPNLPALRIQYKDYVSWQLELLQTQTYKQHRNYWLKQLSGKLPLLDLPNQKQRAKVQTYNGQTLSTYISEKDSGKLREFCLEHGGTLFFGALTIWNILFYRYTKMTDIILGSPIAGRDNSDLEDQIGVYMNMLVLRNQLYPEESFKETFLRVKESTLESLKHQAYPVDRLMDDLDLKYDPSRNPIYDVMLSFHNAGENLDVLEDLSEEAINEIKTEELKTSKLDILINFMEHGKYLYFDVNYNTDLYEEQTIRIMMRDFKKLLGMLLDHPDQGINMIDYNHSFRNDLRKRNKTKFKTKLK